MNFAVSARRAHLHVTATSAVFLVLVVLWAALGQAAAQPAEDTRIQRLEVEKVIIKTKIGSFDIDAEIADEPHEQSRGLMYRTDLGPGQGMLFDFGETRPVTMWMKNTPLSLDMVFVKPDGTVARVAERTEPFSEAIIPSGEPVSHVLELRGGVARMIGLKEGDRLEHHSFTQGE